MAGAKRVIRGLADQVTQVKYMTFVPYGRYQFIKLESWHKSNN